MTLKLIAILTILILFKGSFAQSNILWSKEFVSTEIAPLNHGPFVKTNGDTICVIGAVKETNHFLLQIEYNMEGKELSKTTFGRNSMSNNIVVDYKLDIFGNIYLLQEIGKDNDLYTTELQKYSKNGELLWTNEIPYQGDTLFRPISIGLIADTCVFVNILKEFDFPIYADDIWSDAPIPLVYAYNTKGISLWKKAINPNAEVVRFWFKIIPFKNEALLLGSSRWGDYSLVKIEPNQTVTAINNLPNDIIDIRLTNEEDLLLFSSSAVYKMDLQGNLIWAVKLDETISDKAIFLVNTVLPDSEGNTFVVCASRSDQYQNVRINIFKLDKEGELVWENIYLGDNRYLEMKKMWLHDENLYLGGSTLKQGNDYNPDFFVLKIDKRSGDNTGKFQFNGKENGRENVTSLAVLSDGKITLTGLSFNDSTSTWITLLLSEISTSFKEVSLKREIKVYHNTATNELTFMLNEGEGKHRVNLFNQAGQLVISKQFKGSKHNLSTSNLKSGIYLYRFTTNNGEVQTGKVVVK